MVQLSESKKESEIIRIMNSINDAVMNHQLPPGTRLVEGQLVAALNANRNHVREALRRLALRHIVTIEPNRGASISQPSVKEARDVFYARTVLEKGVIELVVDSFDERIARALKRHVDAEKQAISDKDSKEIIRLSGDFHLRLANLCGNPVLESMLSDLITRSSLIIALYQRKLDSRGGCQEHGDLIRYMENGDKEGAVSLIMHHLEHIYNTLDLDFAENKTVDLGRLFSS